MSPYSSQILGERDAVARAKSSRSRKGSVFRHETECKRESGSPLKITFCCTPNLQAHRRNTRKKARAPRSSRVPWQARVVAVAPLRVG
jgi:hypothetical protein